MTDALGYLKYSGKLVDDGVMDARKSAQALMGFDTSLRYFIEYFFPPLKNSDFEVPVMIQKGSWEILLPKTVVTP